MNKEEYLQELEIHLKKHLSRPEVADILRDYGEYFEDGRRQNKTDTEISAKLGDPAMIAQQFIEENNENDAPKRENPMEEIGKLTEKAVQGIVGVKKKLSFSWIRRPVHVLGNLFVKLVHGLWRFAKRVLRFCGAAACAAASIVLLFAAAFFYLLFVGVITFAALFLLGFGIFGLLFTVVALNFVSAFFAAAGIFASLFFCCAGLLLGLLSVYLIQKCWRAVKAICKWLLGKMVSEEATVHV